jgi:hypothetical protein
MKVAAAVLAALAAGLLLEPALGWLGDRDVALLAAVGFASGIGSAFAPERPWTVPASAHALAWAVILALGGPLAIACGDDGWCTVSEGCGLSAWLALAAPTALAAAMGIALAARRLRAFLETRRSAAGREVTSSDARAPDR